MTFHATTLYTKLEVFMKKTRRFIAILFATALAFAFTACENDDDDDDNNSPTETANSKLPAPVGENPFSGNVYSANHIEYKFNATTVTKNTATYILSKATKLYNYSYNTTKKLLYLELVSLSDGTNTWESAAEYESYAKEQTSDYTLLIETQGLASEFALPMTFKYTVGDELQLDGYCDGTLSMAGEFSNSAISGQLWIKTHGNQLRIIPPTSASTDTYMSYLTLNNNEFFGILMNIHPNDGDYGSYTEVGTIAGGYAVTPDRLGGGKLTLTFSTLPTSNLGVKANDPFTLDYSGLGGTYTKVIDTQ